jgi:hypothetical protein
MGYSVAVPLKSAKARDECLAFLRANFRTWTAIKPTIPDDVLVTVFDAHPTHDWTQELCADQGAERLDYDRGSNRVGFNCSMSGGFIGEYAAAVLRFCALRWGRVQKLKKLTGLDVPVPYWVYDGYEPRPVLLHHVWASRVPREVRWCLSDELGFKPFRRPWYGPWPPDDSPVAVVFHPFLKLTEGVRSTLLRLGATPEALDLDHDGRIESTDPLVVEEVAEAFAAEGLEHHVEYGPRVLEGWRKENADREEATYRAVERAVYEELARLGVQAGDGPA